MHLIDLSKTAPDYNQYQNHNNEISENDDLSIAEREQDLTEEIVEKKQKGLLRTGFTTGTSASAATKSALLSLLTNKTQESVSIALPKGKVVDINIAWTHFEGNS
ncbi:MAG: cobalt-precorrin-5B (C(1))-methyltransferase, partial [Candidatus Nitrosocosmicus sp.]